jgi:predicted transcriptional regulator
MTSVAPTSTETRALSLLGAGVSPEQVAAALGVTPSAISQMLSREDFALAVSQLRYEALSKHNERDSTYDSLEDKLLLKLKDLLPLMMRPMEVLKALQVLNGAKRRGQSAPEQITNQQTVVNITMPTTIVNKFVTNSRNQVIQAGTQELETLQSGVLLRQFKGEGVANDMPRLATHTHASNGESNYDSHYSSAVSQQQETSRRNISFSAAATNL